MRKQLAVLVNTGILGITLLMGGAAGDGVTTETVQAKQPVYGTAATTSVVNPLTPTTGSQQRYPLSEDMRRRISVYLNKNNNTETASGTGGSTASGSASGGSTNASGGSNTDASGGSGSASSASGSNTADTGTGSGSGSSNTADTGTGSGSGSSNTAGAGNTAVNTVARGNGAPYARSIDYSVTYEYLYWFPNAKDDKKTDYRVVAEVLNTGSGNLKIKEATFELLDKGGSQLASDKLAAIPEIIAPGERAYLYSPKTFSAPKNAELGDGCRIAPHVTAESTTGSAEDVDYSNITLWVNDDGYLELSGYVYNTTDQAISGAKIAVPLYGRDGGRLFDVIYAEFSQLAAGEARNFRVRTDNQIWREDISNYQIIAKRTPKT